MRTVIEGVLAAEAEAHQILRRARNEADACVQASREAAVSLAAQNRREDREEADRIVAAAEAEVAAQIREQIARTERDLQAGIQLSAADRNRTVQRVVNAVLGVRA
jgi:vacuolar-type H+-ATPase subunit H